MILAALLFLAAPAARPFAEERALLDRRLETLRRLLPDGPNPSGDIATLREIAEAAHLQQFDAASRPALESGRVGSVALDAQATGRFPDVNLFFQRIAQLSRPVDVESLALKATPEGLVRLTCTVRFPFRVLKAPLPAAPAVARPPGAATRPQLEAYVRDHNLLFAKSDSVATLRRTRRNPRLFLAELAAIARERPVVFTEASLGDDFLVRGLTIGEAPSRDLGARFERGFFRLSDFLMARQGACRRFEAKGTSPIVGPDAELPLPSEDPFRQDDSPCKVDRDGFRGSTITLPAPPGKPGAARGGLTLRLRDVDLADVFYALHQLTKRGFLVDGDVAGRVNLDVSGATLDDLLQALRKSGLRISEGMTLVRVSLESAPPGRPRVGPPAPDQPDDVSAKRASFELKREGVREILAVMTDIEPTLAALGPQGGLGRVSLWASDALLLEARAALLDAAGLLERLEEARRVVRRPASLEDAVFPVASAPLERRLALRAQDLNVMDFEMAGVGSNGSGFVVFTYAPTGRLLAYRAGDKLADATIKAINSTDVELDTEEGPLRLLVPGLPR